MENKEQSYTLKIHKQDNNTYCEVRRKQNNSKQKQIKMVAFCMLDEWQIRLMKKMGDIKIWEN